MFDFLPATLCEVTTEYTVGFQILFYCICLSNLGVLLQSGDLVIKRCSAMRAQPLQSTLQGLAGPVQSCRGVAGVGAEQGSLPLIGGTFFIQKLSWQ